MPDISTQPYPGSSLGWPIFEDEPDTKNVPDVCEVDGRFPASQYNKRDRASSDDPRLVFLDCSDRLSSRKGNPLLLICNTALADALALQKPLAAYRQGQFGNVFG